LTASASQTEMPGPKAAVGRTKTLGETAEFLFSARKSRALWDMGGPVFMALGLGQQSPPAGLAGGNTVVSVRGGRPDRVGVAG
jgi:hypothetical protein